MHTLTLTAFPSNECRHALFSILCPKKVCDEL